MTVESFDPSALDHTISDARLARLLDAACALEAENFGLSAQEVRDLAAVSRHPESDWSSRAETLDEEEICALIRLFTLAESRLAGWESGAGSPVVPLAAALKGRGSYPADLTRWIKSNTANRFLPYGNLMDRL
ncbi:MAG: hypothetical protein GWM88_16795 [Pseudomonadales bacterium]|nr:hypothetical protein [Pseudomonadales bacterium]NIX09589.1 hypothetical protein [Pseudomonadales bacterium]